MKEEIGESISAQGKKAQRTASHVQLSRNKNSETKNSNVHYHTRVKTKRKPESTRKVPFYLFFVFHMRICIRIYLHVCGCV